ncbi:glycosyltransferase family 2 protein [Paenibacillus lutrae]|uniref:4,4'-diaponeurosporenoate glycosyltransferase n=1 Tax=Paenibacillus lutrae TaxID=2078573 RepID=A0A7X3JXH4_9BACL|nr:glycosyltransferase [Paenibacillus lutrae]MVO97950.1 glycosyltransferase [Paenibacillus lutrae]
MKKRRNALRKRRYDFTSKRGYINDPSPKVSVIIPVYNERRRLAAVIREAYRAHSSIEVIVVINGSTDGSRRLAEKMGARIISYADPLGHDVGRAVGARAALGDIVLFTDGDIVIPAGKLAAFIHAVESGVDVAMNTYIGPSKRSAVHRVILAKHALTAFMQRPDLSGTSLTTIPHALSRRALDAIGTEVLAVPPKALAAAVRSGLLVKAVEYVAVGAKNPLRRKGAGRDPVGDLIVGDHLEALHYWLEAAALPARPVEPAEEGENETACETKTEREPEAAESFQQEITTAENPGD